MIMFSQICAKALCAFWLLSLSSPFLAASEVVNFVLLDQQGRAFELRRSEARAVVLFFTANGCPVARQYASKLKTLRDVYSPRGIDIVMVNSSSGDDRASIVKEMGELGISSLPVLKDDTQGVARHLGVLRTGEVVAINTKDWSVFYRGAVDDQVVEGAQKPQVTEHYIEAALEDFLAGRDIAQAKTVARGCLITFDGGEGPDSATVSYSKHVVPILQKKCVSCHSPGNIGSWSMSGHRKVKSMGAMIEEVLLTRRMPPWDADPEIGKFANDRGIGIAEAQTLLRWLKQGAPRGEGADGLEKALVEPTSAWPLGQPDIVLRLPKPEEIPATGVLDYRRVVVRAGNRRAGWVGGYWVRPGNYKVVHHVTARIINNDIRNISPSRLVETFALWAPGYTQGLFPLNSGMPIPADAFFELELHYTTIGTPTTDQTEIGLYLLREKPPLRYENIRIWSAFEIAPGDANAKAEATFRFHRAATLHRVTPHMHVRGRSMKFDILGPDEQRETIASVPRYDFNWQISYQLATPRKIPAGSTALISGTFDNSSRNPANPDPTKTIKWGAQTSDEMFIGFMGVTWDQ